MTDTPVTPEIRKLVTEICELAEVNLRYDAEKLLASAIAQAVQAERAKRGELIEDTIDAIEEIMGHNSTNLLRHDGCLTCRMIECLRERQRKLREALRDIQTMAGDEIAAGTCESSSYMYQIEADARAVLAETEGL